MSKKSILQIIIITLIAIGFGVYFYLDYFKKEQVVENPEYEAIRNIATLNIVRTDLSEELKTKYQNQFEQAAKVFLDKPKSAESFWPLITMAQVKEFFGDIDGARDALLWANVLQPNSFVSNANLANLYFHQYNDFSRAEEYYLKAIEPDDIKVIAYYLDLHELYRFFYKKETTLAEDILKQGIEKYQKDYPNETTNLMAVLAAFYKDSAKYSQAKEYYQKILAINPKSEVAKRGLGDLRELGY